MSDQPRSPKNSGNSLTSLFEQYSNAYAEILGTSGLGVTGLLSQPIGSLTLFNDIAAISSKYRELTRLQNVALSGISPKLSDQFTKVLNQANEDHASYSKAFAAIQRLTIPSLSVKVADIMADSSLAQLTLQNIKVVPAIELTGVLRRLNFELANIQDEAMTMDSLDSASQGLVQEFTSEIEKADRFDIILSAISSLEERLEELGAPARRTIIEYMMAILLAIVALSSETLWTDYLTNEQVHYLQYREGVEALQVHTEIDPGHSVSNASGVIRHPCVAVENRDGDLHQFKLAAGTLVKITRRRQKSVEVRWLDGDEICSGWIRISHVGFPKRFK